MAKKPALVVSWVLYGLLGAASLYTCYLTEKCTWKFGGAAWASWTAKWKVRNEPPAAHPSLEEMEALRQGALYWGKWRDAAGWASAATFAISLLVLVLRRSTLSVVAFAICFVATFFSFQAWGTLF